MVDIIRHDEWRRKELTLGEVFSYSVPIQKHEHDDGYVSEYVEVDYEALEQLFKAAGYYKVED